MTKVVVRADQENSCSDSRARTPNRRNNRSHVSQSDNDTGQTTAALYKTELCKSYQDSGYCRYGLKCRFAHGHNDLRPVTRHKKYKTEHCNNFAQKGFCPYGSRCRFLHVKPDGKEVDVEGTFNGSVGGTDAESEDSENINTAARGTPISRSRHNRSQQGNSNSSSGVSSPYLEPFSPCHLPFDDGKPDVIAAKTGSVSSSKSNSPHKNPDLVQPEYPPHLNGLPASQWEESQPLQQPAKQRQQQHQEPGQSSQQQSPWHANTSMQQSGWSSSNRSIGSETPPISPLRNKKRGGVAPGAAGRNVSYHHPSPRNSSRDPNIAPFLPRHPGQHARPHQQQFHRPPSPMHGLSTPMNSPAHHQQQAKREELEKESIALKEIKSLNFRDDPEQQQQLLELHTPRASMITPPAFLDSPPRNSITPSSPQSSQLSPTSHSLLRRPSDTVSSSVQSSCHHSTDSSPALFSGLPPPTLHISGFEPLGTIVGLPLPLQTSKSLDLSLVQPEPLQGGTPAHRTRSCSSGHLVDDEEEDNSLLAAVNEALAGQSPHVNLTPYASTGEDLEVFDNSVAPISKHNSPFSNISNYCTSPQALGIGPSAFSSGFSAFPGSGLLSPLASGTGTPRVKQKQKHLLGPERLNHATSGSQPFANFSPHTGSPSNFHQKLLAVNSHNSGSDNVAPVGGDATVQPPSSTVHTPQEQLLQQQQFHLHHQQQQQLRTRPTRVLSPTRRAAAPSSPFLSMPCAAENAAIADAPLNSGQRHSSSKQLSFFTPHTPQLSEL
eukprot:CAMPEP_0175127500 /NCGR_PEP_ID=MMETSP0087-20121206/4418_1 /TAXON_ID=136419 /ORGANISM="Unknown Unknown, Strain D1" /LENGTH=774 /DNA_ID=CAMNT_0016409479 /DNA_START=66 /DNA_END=2390 /DNA_ORIENTATION=+